MVGSYQKIQGPTSIRVQWCLNNLVPQEPGASSTRRLKHQAPQAPDWFGLVVFYVISTLVDYLSEILFIINTHTHTHTHAHTHTHTHIYIYIYIYIYSQRVLCILFSKTYPGSMSEFQFLAQFPFDHFSTQSCRVLYSLSLSLSLSPSLSLTIHSCHPLLLTGVLHPVSAQS